MSRYLIYDIELELWNWALVKYTHMCASALFVRTCVGLPSFLLPVSIYFVFGPIPFFD